MPELPEVETVRKGLEPVWLNKKIKRVTVNRRDLRGGISAGLEESLAGQEITSLIRRGKYILAFTQSGVGFVLHLGMSGRVRIIADGADDEELKHDHVIWHMADKTRVIFNDSRRFGMLYTVTHNTWQNDKPFSAMGAEPLSDNFDGRTLHEKLKAKKTPIKTALLDQRVVAGVGNIYACEALYEACVSPFRLAQDVSEKECVTLAERIKDVLARAIESGGSTLRDYAKTDGTMGYFQHSFHVYDKEGEACPRCKDTAEHDIKREVQAGRSTFYCERCQI